MHRNEFGRKPVVLWRHLLGEVLGMLCKRSPCGVLGGLSPGLGTLGVGGGGTLQAVWPKTGNITSLSLNFHIYKVQTVIDTLQLIVRIKWEHEYKDYGAFHVIMIIAYKYNICIYIIYFIKQFLNHIFFSLSLSQPIQGREQNVSFLWNLFRIPGQCSFHYGPGKLLTKNPSSLNLLFS